MTHLRLRRADPDPLLHTFQSSASSRSSTRMLWPRRGEAHITASSPTPPRLEREFRGPVSERVYAHGLVVRGREWNHVVAMVQQRA